MDQNKCVLLLMQYQFVAFVCLRLIWPLQSPFRMRQHQAHIISASSCGSRRPFQDWALGMSRVFLRAGQLKALEDLRSAGRVKAAGKQVGDVLEQLEAS